MIRNKLLFSLALGAMILTSSSCGGGENDEPIPPTDVTIAVDPTEFTIDKEAQTLTLNVKASAGWGITSSADWVSCRPSGGLANETTPVTLTVKALTGMDARTATLTVRASGKTATVTVTQNPAANLTLSATSIPFGAQASTGNVTVTCNTDWTASTTADWVTLGQTEGVAGETVMEIFCTANTGKTERTAIVTFGYPGGTKELEIRQMTDEITAPEGYTMVWHDEFNSGEMPNTELWWYETGGGGWGNNELQTYVAGRQGNEILAKIDNGILHIICAKIGSAIYSIRMNTKDAWTYGYFEARLKLPKGKGTWPAYWMMPKNYTTWPGDGEIDIMEEVGYHPNYVSSSIHCNAYNHSIGTQKTNEILVPTAQEDFHVYALEWTADLITTYVDGKRLFSFPNDRKGDKNTWPFNAPFYLKLNLAWGGNWGGAQGVDESCLPADYQVDYVRVFQK